MKNLCIDAEQKYVELRSPGATDDGRPVAPAQSAMSQTSDLLEMMPDTTLPLDANVQNDTSWKTKPTCADAISIPHRQRITERNCSKTKLANTRILA